MVLYTDEEIQERVEGLIELMFEQPVNDIEYQAYVFKIILYELFRDANRKYEESLQGKLSSIIL